MNEKYLVFSNDIATHFMVAVAYEPELKASLAGTTARNLSHTCYKEFLNPYSDELDMHKSESDLSYVTNKSYYMCSLRYATDRLDNLFEYCSAHMSQVFVKLLMEVLL